MKEVEIIADKEGQVTFNYSGFEDKSCLSLHEEISRELAALGIEITNSETEYKPEASRESSESYGVRY